MKSRNYENLIKNEFIEKNPKNLKRKKRQAAALIWPQNSRFNAEFYITIPLLAPTGLCKSYIFVLGFHIDFINWVLYATGLARVR